MNILETVDKAREPEGLIREKNFCIPFDILGILNYTWFAFFNNANLPHSLSYRDYQKLAVTYPPLLVFPSFLKAMNSNLSAVPSGCALLSF